MNITTQRKTICANKFKKYRVKLETSTQKTLNKKMLEYAYQNNGEKVIECINKGADIDAQDKSGKTALMHASLNKNKELTNKLIELGANIFIVDNVGMSFYNTAWTTSLASLRNKILKTKINEVLKDKALFNRLRPNLLLWACSLGRCSVKIKLLKKVIESGIDVNKPKTKNGLKAINLAFLCNNIEAINILLKNGADPFDVGTNNDWRLVDKKSIEKLKSTTKTILQKSSISKEKRKRILSFILKNCVNDEELIKLTLRDTKTKL